MHPWREGQGANPQAMLVTREWDNRCCELQHPAREFFNTDTLSVPSVSKKNTRNLTSGGQGIAGHNGFGWPTHSGGTSICEQGR